MVQLIKYSLIFILNNFQQITSFILNDNSYIECNDKTRLFLAELYNIKYKKRGIKKCLMRFQKKKKNIKR